MLTKKYYKTIAEAMNSVYNEVDNVGRKAIYLTAIELCREFKDDNPKFNKEKFLSVVTKETNDGE